MRNVLEKISKRYYGKEDSCKLVACTIDFYIQREL